MGLSWINAQFDTPYDMTEPRRVFDLDLTRLADFLERRVQPSTTALINTRRFPRFRVLARRLACRDMNPRVAIAPQRLRCFCSTSRDGPASLWATDAGGVTYRVLGADLADELAGLSRGASFRRVHRGVLVGQGPLNNRLLTLLLELTVRRDGTATADVIAARIDAPQRDHSPSKRGLFPDCEGSGEP